LNRGGLAYVVTPGTEGMLVTPLPLVFQRERRRLVGHLARANRHWRDAPPGAETVAIYAGPDAYISPSSYPSKREHGKVVPTWDYETVTVYGDLTFHDDTDWIRENVEDLTAVHEAGRDPAWTLDEAPGPYVAQMLKAIVGVELTITRWEGKAKMSQNQSDPNVQGVLDDLAARDTHQARAAAERIEHYR
ncbi:MAG: FMN-binding negative transcriptional regulator, partial [Gordonia sp. (in: high G+C Gram-positive bacteria)]